MGCWDEQLLDQPRRPRASPGRTADRLEASVLEVRDAHPAWGARKIHRCLARQGIAPPAVSTIHQILRRHDRIVPAPGGEAARLRFEKDAPNQLWQMDFKGWVRLGDGTICHPLTVIDDHARFALCLSACTDQTGPGLRERSASTACRRPSSSTMARPGAMPRGSTGPGLKSGFSSSASA